jgi:hypothetical protein
MQLFPPDAWCRPVVCQRRTLQVGRSLGTSLQSIDSHPPPHGAVHSYYRRSDPAPGHAQQGVCPRPRFLGVLCPSPSRAKSAGANVRSSVRLDRCGLYSLNLQSILSRGGK